MSQPQERTSSQHSILGRLRSRLGLGRNGANPLEHARELRTSGDLDGAVILLREVCAKPTHKLGDSDAVLELQQARLLLAEYHAETGLRDGDADAVREGIQKLVALPTMNVNALRQGVIQWPEKLTRAEEFFGTLLATEWNPGSDKRGFLSELVALASAWNLLLEPEAARRVCLKGFDTLHSDHPGLLIVLAEAEFGLGNPHRALECLARALRSGTTLETDSLAVALLGSIQRGEDRDLANHADALVAELHCLQGRWTQGLPMLQRTLEKQGDRADIESIVALLNACIRSRHFQEFETAAALLLHREIPEPIRSRLHLETGDLATKNPDRPKLRGILNILRYRGGEGPAAFADLSILLAGNPDAGFVLQLNHSLLPAASAPAADRANATLEFAQSLFAAGSLEATALLLASLENSDLSPAQLDTASTLAAELARRLPDSIPARTAHCDFLLRTGSTADAVAAGAGIPDEPATATLRNRISEAKIRLDAARPAPSATSPTPSSPPLGVPPPPHEPVAAASALPTHTTASAPVKESSGIKAASTEIPPGSLDAVLEKFRAASQEVEACAVVSTDGFVLASRLQSGVEEDRVASACAALVAVVDQIGRDLNRGHVDQIHLRGSDGLLVLVAAGDAAYLISLCRKSATLGPMLVAMNRVAQELAKLL